GGGGEDGEGGPARRRGGAAKGQEQGRAGEGRARRRQRARDERDGDEALRAQARDLARLPRLAGGGGAGVGERARRIAVFAQARAHRLRAQREGALESEPGAQLGLDVRVGIRRIEDRGPLAHAGLPGTGAPASLAQTPQLRAQFRSSVRAAQRVAPRKRSPSESSSSAWRTTATALFGWARTTRSCATTWSGTRTFSSRAVSGTFPPARKTSSGLPTA